MPWGESLADPGGRLPRELRRQEPALLAALAAEFVYETDGGDRHFVPGVELTESAGRVTHPRGRGGKLTLSSTGDVAGMILDRHDPGARGTYSAERLAVWSMSDAELERPARLVGDAPAMRRAARGEDLPGLDARAGHGDADSARSVMATPMTAIWQPCS